jgi:hypothetical protein
MAPVLQGPMRKRQTQLNFAPVNPKLETKSSPARVMQKPASPSGSKARSHTPPTVNDTLEGTEPKESPFQDAGFTPSKEPYGIVGSGSLLTPLKSSLTTPRSKRR